MLSPRDLATVTSKLQLPVIISDILSGAQSLSDEARYGLHNLISEMQPDSALLSIALSGKKLSAAYSDIGTSMDILSIECDKIIEEYAAVWLSHACAEDLDETQVFDLLCHLPEDLEYMSDLLTININALQGHCATGESLCRIMKVQAEAQALIAESFSETLSENIMTSDEAIEKEAEIAPFAAQTVMSNNIIPFPSLQK